MANYPYADIFEAAGDAQGLPRGLLPAIARRESGFDPNAIGDAGTSFGLGQINIYGAGAGYTPEQLMDPATNISIMGRHMRTCADAFPGDWYRAIAAYRQGVGGVLAHGPINEGNYISDILNYWQEYSGRSPYGPRLETVLLLAAAAWVLLD